MSQTLSKVQGELRNLSSAAQHAGASAKAAGPGFTSMTAAVAAGTLAANGLMAALRGAAGIVTGAVSTFGDYEAQMNILKVTTKATDEQMAMMGKRARELGADLDLPNTSSAGAAKSMLELAKGGLDVDNVMKAVKGSLQLAAAAGIDEAKAAQLTTGALNAFGLGGEYATKVSNQLAYAANASSLDAAELGQAVAQAGFIFKATGRPIEELIGGMIVLGNAGLTGSDGATALKNALMQAVSPTDKARGVMDQYGITLHDAQGKMKALPDIIDHLNARLGHLTDEERNAALSTIFMSDGMKALIPLMAAGGDKVRAYVKDLGDTTAASDQATARAAGLQGAMKGLHSQWETAQETLGSKLAPALEKGIRFLADFTGEAGKAIEAFDFGPIGDAVESGLSTASDALYGAGQAVSDWAETNLSKTDGVQNSFRTLAAISGSVLTGLAALLRGDPKGAMEAFGQAGKDAGTAFADLQIALDNLNVKQDVVAIFQNLGGALDAVATAISNFRGATGGQPIIKEEEANRAWLLAAALKGVAAVLVGLTSFIEIVVGGFAKIGIAARAEIEAIGLMGEALKKRLTGDAEGADKAWQAARAVMDKAHQDIDRITAEQQKAIERDKKSWKEFEDFLAGRKIRETIMSFADIPAQKPEVATVLEDVFRRLPQDAELSRDQIASIMADIPAQEPEVADALERIFAQLPEHASTAAQGVERGMGTVALAVDTNLSEAAAAADAQMAQLPAAAETNAAAATAAIEAQAPAMAAAAESGASGAVAAVEGQSGPAAAAGESVGSNLGSGLASGILSWIGQVRAAAASLVSAAIGAGNVEGEIESPSKRTQKTGRALAEGVGVGIDELAPAIAEKMRDLIDAAASYAPHAAEIARVEREIKEIREQGQVDALFRAREMVTIDSEALRLKQAVVTLERDSLSLRQDLARATREVADIERGSLSDRTAIIEMDGKGKELRLQQIELEKQLIGLDPSSKKAKGIQEQISQLQDQARLLSLESEQIRLTNDVAATGAKIRREALEEQTRGQETVIQRIRDQLDVLAAERAVFDANEAIIKNATENEITYREQLIAVFESEAKPLTDRIEAGLKLVDQLEAEGAISGELARQLREAAKHAQGGVQPTKDLGKAASDAADGFRELASSAGKLPSLFKTSFDFSFDRRALGGAVSAAMPYLVGERGPELFVPSTAGTILDHATTDAILNTTGASGARGAVGSGGYGIYVAPGALVVQGNLVHERELPGFVTQMLMQGLRQ